MLSQAKPAVTQRCTEPLAASEKEGESQWRRQPVVLVGLQAGTGHQNVSWTEMLRYVSVTSGCSGHVCQ